MKCKLLAALLCAATLHAQTVAVTTILGSDQVSASRTTINTNFTNIKTFIETLYTSALLKAPLASPTFTGTVTAAGGFVGPLTGNVVGAVSGNASTATAAATSSFQLGTGGPVLKNSSGTIEARNAADSAYAAVRALSFEAGDGTAAGRLCAAELAANGTDEVCFVAADSIATSVDLKFPTSGSGTIDFGSIPDGGCLSDTITLTGAVTGDAVAPKWPAALEAGLIGMMHVSATNTVQVRLCNLSGAAINPASASFGATAQ